MIGFFVRRAHRPALAALFATLLLAGVLAWVVGGG